MAKTSDYVIDAELARKVVRTVDAGLTEGEGDPKPGAMCVEAAVCYAMGLPHGDDPPCVNGQVRFLKIRLNDDGPWQSKAERARALRRLAVAQLGTDRLEWCRDILPKALELVLWPAAVALIERNLARPVSEERTSSWTTRFYRPLVAADTYQSFRTRAVARYDDPEFRYHDVAFKVLHCFARTINSDTLADAVLYTIRESPTPRAEAAAACERLVQALKAAGAPGAKFLRLCPLPKKKTRT